MNTHKDKIIEEAKKCGVETDINKRWEKGIQHHQKSVEIVESLVDIDLELCDDYFCWKVGGDGDNGETLMYEMDIYFETLDKLNK